MPERPQVKFENIDGSQIATFADGSKEEFRTPIRNLAIEAQSLAVTHSYDWNAKEIRLGQDDATVSGKGCLGRGDTLCVIGKPDTKSPRISLSIRSADFSSYQDLEDPPINANLSYIEADWEIGNSSEWWVGIYIPIDLFTRLTLLIQEHRLDSLTIRLRSNEFLVKSFDFHTPPSGYVTWYIKDGEYGADMLNCSTAIFYIKERNLNLCATSSEGQYSDADNSYEAPTVELDATSPSLALISQAQFNALSKSFYAIFWGLIAVAAAILYQK